MLQRAAAQFMPWLGKWSRVTKRLAESVGRLCEVLAIKHAAAFYGLGWDAVKQIHKAYLAEKLGPPRTAARLEMTMIRPPSRSLTHFRRIL